MPFYELKKIEKQKGEECLSNEIFVKLQNFKSQKKGIFFSIFPHRPPKNMLPSAPSLTHPWTPKLPDLAQIKPLFHNNCFRGYLIWGILIS